MSDQQWDWAQLFHDRIDGDFLVGAGGYGEDIAISQGGAADVVRWACSVVAPEVVRLTKVQGAAELRADQNASRANIADRRAVRAEADLAASEQNRRNAEDRWHETLAEAQQLRVALADEKRRHAERVEWLAGHEWSGGYFCACGHELNSPRGYLAHLRALLCQNDAMPPVDYVENLPHLLSDTTTDADEPMSELR